jgi:hypothetical protein
MKSMLRTLIAAAALTALTANAEFTDYLALEPESSFYSLPPYAAQFVGLPAAFPGGWWAQNYGLASCEWQRSPWSTQMRAQGFTLTLIGAGKVGLEIPAPTFPSSPVSVPPGLDPSFYRQTCFFHYAIDVRNPWTHVWFVDRRGEQYDLVPLGFIGLATGQNLQFQVDQVANGSATNYGFWVESLAGANVQTLQVMSATRIPLDPKITSLVRRADGSLQLDALGGPDQPVSLLVTSDLGPSAWWTLAQTSVFDSAGAATFIVTPAGAAGTWFYRLSTP